jgi:transposase-like protein
VPWKEACPMDERVQFIAMYLQKEWSIAELCGEFGIGRPTGYKRIARYKEGGVETLEAISQPLQRNEKASNMKKRLQQHPIYRPLTTAITL